MIGNSAYKESPLKNPANDAADMAAALKELGFKVTLRTDASQRQMKQALREFAQDLRRGGVGLFYFAGHGVQSKGRNFLIPIGANVETEAELEDESVDANLVLSYMDEAQNRVNIVVLDACRNNPFARSFRSASRGLAQMDAAKGSFVAFATAPGSVAADGDGRNGVYTEHLLASLKEADGDIDKVFRRVAANVSTVTGGKQVPWVASSLTGDFYFRMPAAKDDSKLKQTEQERGQLARELEEARKQRAQDAELVRAEIDKLRAELQKIRAEAAPPPVAPTAASTVTNLPAAKPAPGTPPEKPVQEAAVSPP
ncbi:MAG: caspase family protein, partial [Acidobacteriota bacterium]